MKNLVKAETGFWKQNSTMATFDVLEANVPRLDALFSYLPPISGTIVALRGINLPSPNPQSCLDPSSVFHRHHVTWTKWYAETA